MKRTFATTERLKTLRSFQKPAGEERVINLIRDLARVPPDWFFVELLHRIDRGDVYNDYTQWVSDMCGRNNFY